MARVNPPGVTEVWWAASGEIANYLAPTSTELDGTTDLTSFVRGVPSIPETGNTADTADLSSKFNKRIPASYGGDNLTIEFWRDDATDTAYTTLTRSTVGFWVVAWDGLATAGNFAASDLVWVYPATLISRGMGSPGRDEGLWFISEAAITNVANERYSLVA
jgi:hypothetical protein